MPPSLRSSRLTGRLPLHRTRERRSRTQWAWLGLAGALMTMVRWQNALFLAFALADGVGELWRAWRGRDAPRGTTVLAGGAAFAATFVIGSLPQLAFWKLAYGGWLAMPDAQTGQQWWADSLMVDVLFSVGRARLRRRRAARTTRTGGRRGRSRSSSLRQGAGSDRELSTTMTATVPRLKNGYVLAPGPSKRTQSRLHGYI